MTQYTAHPAVVYDMPLPYEIEVLQPETAILRFSNNNCVDLGALCYLCRETSPGVKRRRKEGSPVDLTSIDAVRTESVRKLIMHVSDKLANKRWQPKTVFEVLRRFIMFVNWVDEKGYADVLSGKQAARAGVHAYAAHIRQLVDSNVISRNSGAQIQRTTFTFLSEFLEVDDLFRGLNLLSKDVNSTESTVPPDEEDQSKVLAMCKAIFKGCSELVLENKPFAYSLKMPKYLNLPEDGLWVFPTTTWCMPPHALEKRTTMKKLFWGYDYRNGRLTTLNELKAIGTLTSPVKVFKGYQKKMGKANTDPQHSQRRLCAARAIYAFMILFVAQTGMNSAQMVELLWSDNDEYEVGPSHQHFRTIKYRAGGRQVSFELPASFMLMFKRYLELRRYLLNGCSCTLLIFTMGQKWTGKPEKINDLSGLLYRFYKALWYIDPHLPKVMPRKWRAAKSDYLVRNHDPEVAAQVLQSSLRTVLKHYAVGSETTHLYEMTTFLNKISATVVAKSEKVKGGVNRATGVCSDYGAPGRIAEDVPVEPDCKGPEGCLFCDKFKVHADEQDTRKLLSCRYCILQTAPLIGSEERFQTLQGPILARIQEMVDEIARRDADLVSRMTREVEENGELHPYWESKLQMMMDLGWIA